MGFGITKKYCQHCMELKRIYVKKICKECYKKEEYRIRNENKKHNKE